MAVVGEGTALAAVATDHGATHGISTAMQLKGIEVGDRYVDMLHPGRLSHVVVGGMASGKDLYVASEAGKAITAYVTRFGPNTVLPSGALRWIPYPK